MRHTNWEKTATVFRGRKSFFPHTSSFAVWTVSSVSLLALLLLIGLASYASLSLFSAPQASAVTTVPTKLNFQGRLSDSAGSIKPNGTYNMKFKLYTVATAGTAVWSEDRLVSATQGVTVTNGLFSVQLGSITSLPASLFASGALYLEVELPTPATATSTTPTWTEGPMTPRNQMATSAYAYNSETLDGLDSSDFAAASGSASYIQNGTSPQTANFSVTGNGVIGGSLNVNGEARVTSTGQNTSIGLRHDNSSGHYIGMVANSSAGAYNPLVSAGDNSLLYSTGTNGNGVLNIMPWSADNGGSIKLNASADTIGLYGAVTANGNLTVTNSGVFSGGAGALSIKPGTQDHAYLQIYADSASPNTRSGYIGYASSGSADLVFVNEIGDVINLGSGGDDTYVSDKLIATGTLQGSQLISTAATGTAPLTVASTTLVANLNSQYLNGYSESQLAQGIKAGFNVSGGGTVTYDGNLNWTSRFIVISSGNGSDFSTSGYFDINVPASGTVITGVGGAANVTTTASGIPMSCWTALYYILPLGGGNVSNNANFRIAHYTAALQVPSNWLLLANQNCDNSTLRIATGFTLRNGQTVTSGTIDNPTFNGAVISSSTIQGSRLISTVATGTAPLTVASTTKVANLNADLLDGLDSTAFAASSGSGSYIQNTTSPQSANFNITGSGTIGGALNAGAQSNFGTTSSCCGANYTLAVSEATSSNGRLPTIQFHTAGSQEGFIRLASSSRTFEFGDTQNTGVSIAALNGAGTRTIELLGASGTLRIGGTNICTSSGCTPTGGSGASLSANNIFTGVNTFQNAVDITGNVSTGTILTIGQTVNQQLVINTSSGGNHGIEMGRTDGVSSTPFIDFHSGSTATDRDARIIASGGNGIAGNGTLQFEAGVTSVTGSFQLSNASTGSGTTICINSGGYLVKASGCSPSSIRYKENVVSLNDTLGILGQLRPVSFDWKASTGKTASNGGINDFGLIAEEVNEVLPEIVLHGEGGEIEGINYQLFTPFLIRAIQQQQSQIASLQAGASLINGGTINGSISISDALNVSGVATLGSLSVTGSAHIAGNLVVIGTLETGSITVNGRIIAKGTNPEVQNGQALGVSDINAVSVTGNDTTGSLKIVTGETDVKPGVLARVTFAEGYAGKAFNVVLSATNSNAGNLRVHIVKTSNGFEVVANDQPLTATEYHFDYIVVGAE